jgi:hypothetical protein
VQYSDSLKSCGLKSLKVKIQEKDNEDSEILGHYFYPQKDGDLNVKTM